MHPSPIKAMILAAGRGERMRPLTDSCPKPLLEVHGKPLMQWPMEALARGGFHDVVVNTAWLGEQISARFDGIFGLQPLPDMRKQLSNSEHAAGSLQITYSHEGVDFGGALETAGGIVRALPHLGDVFWLLAGDVFVPDFVFSQAAVERFAASGKLAHIWLVPNPEHNLKGDFGLSPDGLALNVPEGDATPKLTAPSACTAAPCSRRPTAAFPPATRLASKPRWRRCCARRWTRDWSPLNGMKGLGPTWAHPRGFSG